VSEFETEYAPGLPERLPEGERMLWQGKPQPLSLALHAYHMRELVAYFAILAIWRGGSEYAAAGSVSSAAIAVVWLVAIALVACGVLFVLAWFAARTTIYTITSRRVIMRFGVALPLTLNIPFCRIDAAAVSLRNDGSGDIPLRLAGNDHIAYAVLWPHVRPWRINRPEPMLRAISDVDHVARILSSAMMAATQSGQAIVDHSETSSRAHRPLAPAMG
jgi:hypothetical protein